MTINEALLAAIAKGTNITANALQAQPPAKQIGANAQLRKRHWFLGSLVILSGSWITHTTTANIAHEPSLLVGQTNASASENTIPNGFYSAVAQNTSPLTPSTEYQDIIAESALENTFASVASIGEPSSELAIGSKAALEHDQKASANERRELKQAEALVSRPHKIKKGESLGIIFRREKLDLAIPHYISLHPVAKQLTSIRVGKTIDFQFDNDNTLREIHYPLSPLKELVVKLDGVQVKHAAVNDVSFDTVQTTISAEINSSLYLAANAAGLSNQLTMEMIRIFGWDIDFVQDIRKGDTFHIVFTEHHKDGEKLSDGHILAAEFTTQGQTHRAIRFENENGIASYFNADGESMLGTFLRSPVEFSRISSRFGKRKHPISKKWRAHKGVDYAASRGTPIRATADGKVILAGRKGGYGKTVVLRHAGRFSTLYAHMNGYAKGIRNGARVKQGQTIGYVGSTGMSTGPHLHYEFRVDGSHRNPLTYKTPKASSIHSSKKSQFLLAAAELGKELDHVKSQYQLAKAKATNKESKKI